MTRGPFCYIFAIVTLKKSKFMRTKNVLFLVACLILSLNVKAQDDYLRVTDLSQIQNGSSVILAARHDSLSTTSYYAMKNDAAGKPQGMSFMTTNSDDGMILPDDITDNESEYCWIVGMSGGDFTFINSKGEMLGYGSSGTDFVKNGVNSTWSIEAAVSGTGTSVPNHNAFVITNVGVANRSIAFRKYSNDVVYEKFAPYSNSTTNLDGDIYFFYIDIFVKSSEVIPVVSLPKFSPESGDYTTLQNVSITCDTEDAVIYYTLDGKNPTEESEVYSSPIEVSSKTTIKAFAKKEGMKDSGVATATFNIVETVDVSFYANGELLQVKTLAKGEAVGELPSVTAPDGFSFNGWSDNEIALSTNVLPNMLTSVVEADEDMNLYAVFSITDNNCVEVQASSLKQSDVVAIVVSKDDMYYAMSQEKGNSGQPIAKELLMSNGTIDSEVTDDIKWNIAYNNGDMIICPNGDNESWLYCTSGSNNNAVRIGTNADNNIFELKTVEVDDVVYPNYLYNKQTERFVGVYYDKDVAVDWRAYKLTASGAFPTNIKNQTYHFFKIEGVSRYCTNVDIPQSQTISTNTTWDNVSLTNKIIVENGAILTVDGVMACTNADNLVIKEGGQLLHNNTGVKATIEKEIQGYGSSNEGWYTISSPLVGNIDMSDVNDLIPSTNDYDLYRYDENTSAWENVKDATNNFTSLESGRGYLYANKYDVTVSFVGEISAESMICDLSKTDGINLSGFNLVGNPFAHNIYMGFGAAIDDENLVKAYYTLSNSGAWEAKVYGNDPIMPCQSILVKTLKTGEITINKTNKVSSQVRENSRILGISIANKDYSDKVYVSLEGEYGLEKIKHQNEEIPMIYIPVDGVNYAVAVLTEEITKIPLSFMVKTMGEYTVSIDSENKIFDNVYLIDNTTGGITNLLVEDYTFIATANDNPNRFVISLKEENSIEENDGNDNFVYVSNGELIINDLSDNAVVEIYDVMGRKVLCAARNGIEEQYSIGIGDFCGGVYVVRVSDDKGIRLQKILL